MAKTLKFLYEGQEITLEFTRKSVEIMESNGFNLSAAAEKPMTTLPALFAGSFLAHHKYMKKEKIDAIFEKMNKRYEIFPKLSEMYMDTLSFLTDEPAESEGNLKWEANW